MSNDDNARKLENISNRDPEKAERWIGEKLIKKHLVVGKAHKLRRSKAQINCKKAQTYAIKGDKNQKNQHDKQIGSAKEVGRQCRPALPANAARASPAVFVF